MNDTTFQGDGKVAYVPVVVNTKLTKQTNADRIRQMTDEELAEWYWWMLKYVQGYTDSRIALIDWLKQEVEE